MHRTKKYKNSESEVIIIFVDGLHNKVDIYFLNSDISGNRINKTDIKLSDKPDLKNIVCRIIKDSKVIFLGEFKLKDGYLIKDIESGLAYEIQAKDSKKIYGLNSVNHSTYNIRIKLESDKHGLH